MQGHVNWEEGNVCLVFIDLIKAFDSVNKDARGSALHDIDVRLNLPTSLDNYTNDGRVCATYMKEGNLDPSASILV